MRPPSPIVGRLARGVRVSHAFAGMLRPSGFLGTYRGRLAFRGGMAFSSFCCLPRMPTRSLSPPCRRISLWLSSALPFCSRTSSSFSRSIFRA